MKLMRKFLFVSVALSAFTLFADTQQPGVSPGPGVRYATDAYPGFDSTDSFLKPERKEPKWFRFWNGPKKDNAAEQLQYSASLIREKKFSKAAKELDALVREWPVSPEAVRAQKALGDIFFKYTDEAEKAAKAYVYLLDFYSFDCDYKAIAKCAYEAAEKMRADGKDVIFFHFDNTVDVRRAYEAIVLRAPGADFAPDALLTIAQLREDEKKPELAISVYENIRNLYPESAQALAALSKEARSRMELLKAHEYNRARTLDTINFLKIAMANPKLSAEARDEIIAYHTDANVIMEGEAYRSAQFYDKPSRTRRSAINAYELFLVKYPSSPYAGVIVDRLHELERLDSLKKKETEE